MSLSVIRKSEPCAASGDHPGGQIRPPQARDYDRIGATRRSTALKSRLLRVSTYNRSLLGLAKHYGFHPRACRPYRAKTKGKVERPFSYIRKDFFLARTFRNLDDLNAQLQDWLGSVANVHLHATMEIGVQFWV